MANWDESKHPRDDDGKFGSGGGSGSGKIVSPEQGRQIMKDQAAKAAKFRAAVKKAAQEPEARRATDAYRKAVASKDRAGVVRAQMTAQKAGLVWDKSLKAFYKPVAGNVAHNADSEYEILYGEAVALNWEAPADGSTQVKVQLSPFGEFTLHDGGKRNGTVQHCSKAAFEALVANWKAQGSPDVLVDVDHASARGGSTEAAAWCNALEVDDNGLQGVFNLTPKGLELVKNRSYRFVSPGWTLSPDGTPVSLCSVALTNRPNLPVKPVVNADETGGRDPDDPNSRKDNPEMDIKKLAAALGLPETATEEEVLAAIKAMQDREAQAAAEAANAKAEEFADNAVKAGKIAANSKEAVKAAYLKSPEVAQEMLNSVAAPAPAAKLPDFTAAKQPTALNARTPGKDADPVEVYNAYMAMPEGADKDAYLAANAQAISDGYEKAQKK